MNMVNIYIYIATYYNQIFQLSTSQRKLGYVIYFICFSMSGCGNFYQSPYDRAICTKYSIYSEKP